jgi:tetraacyldisaccharide 4'-kinase
VLLLDDGFQALQIRRDFDVVLVSERQPLDAGSVLPVGPLREGPEALGAADLVVMTGGEARSEARRAEPDRPVVHAVRRLAGFYSWPSGTRARIEDLTARPLLAFAGLADPRGFWDDLEHSGLTVASHVAFPDHHHYRPRDLHGLSSAARQMRAVALVTTEKDAVRVPPWLAPELPVFVAKMELTIQGSAWQVFVDSIRETVNRHENK